MKCKSCGGTLSFKDNTYICDYCGSKYRIAEKPKAHLDVLASKAFKIHDGVLLKYMGSQDDVIIPDGILSIGKEAFKNNLIIKSVNFSNTVIEVQDSAFEGCINLKIISNYSSIVYFKNECFKNAGLEEITIGNKVMELGEYCFSNMPNLQKVSIFVGKLLTYKGTFIKCPKLKNVEMNDRYFSPFYFPKDRIKNNLKEKRSTYFDAFKDTPYYYAKKKELVEKYAAGICADCGGKIKKGLLHSKCLNCGIDYQCYTGGVILK